MAKHKMVQYNLVRNSISAYFSAIELHNKPNISYRYETETLLIINAWELLLKAFIRKNMKNKSIFKNSGHTISLDFAVRCVEEYINSNGKKHGFKATKENLQLLEEYRNNVVHFYNEAIEPIIFTLIAKSALDFVEFARSHFNKDVVAHDGLFIMPLGFKLPFKPEDFLSKKSANYNYSPETKKFIDNVVTVVSDLKNEGIEDSVVLGFNVFLDSVKKLSNSDLLVAITNKEEADLNLTQTKNIRFTSDHNATKVMISDSELYGQFPLVHKDITNKCKSSLW